MLTWECYTQSTARKSWAYPVTYRPPFVCQHYVGYHYLYLTGENIDHPRTKVKSPQTNGIRVRFHRTLLNESYRLAFRKRIYERLEELPHDVDVWVQECNEACPHQERWC